MAQYWAAPFESTATGAAVVATFVLAGLVKGLVGLGLPTVSMALLALLLPPAQAAALLVIPSLVTNVWQMRPFSRLPRLWSRLAAMQWASAAGTVVVAAWAGAPAGIGASIALGVVLVAYGGWGLMGRSWQLDGNRERWLAPAGGAATGAIAALTGVFVVPAVPLLQAMGLGRDQLVRAMGLSFSVSTVALALGLAINGRFPAATLGVSSALLLPALAGMALGCWLRGRLPETIFRKVLMASLLLLGAYMVVRGALAGQAGC